jgi:hypothetical protein
MQNWFGIDELLCVDLGKLVNSCRKGAPSQVRSLPFFAPNQMEDSLSFFSLLSSDYETPLFSTSYSTIIFQIKNHEL